MKHKKIMLIFICTFFLFTLFTPAHAFAAKSKPFTLRVGYWPGYGISKSENGSLSGYTYDYMNEIARVNQWELEFIACDWNEAMELLSQGELDLFGPMEWTPERAEKFDYPSRSMGEECGTLYVHEDNNTIFYDDATSLNGKKLGTMEGNFFAETLDKYCAENHIAFQTVKIDSAKELDEALSDGTIDVRVSGSMQLPDNTKLVLSFDGEDVFYTTTKGNKFVLDGLNSALEFIQTENPYYNLRLYEKHYARLASSKKAFTAAEAEFIKNAPVLRVGYESSGRPIEYYDANTMSAKGISIDLLQKVSEYSGLQFDFVKTESMEQALQFIDDGKIQLVSGLVGGENFEELYHLAPTNPLMENMLAFIVKQGATFGEKQALLALPEKWIGIRNHIEKNYPDLIINEYPDMEACLDAVQNGQADLTVLNTLAAEKALKAYRYKELTVNSMSNGAVAICLGTARDADPILRAVINKAVAAIDNSTRKQIVYQHTISRPYEPSFSEIMYYNIPVIFFGILLFLIVLYVFSLSARKRLNALAFLDPLTGEMNLNKFKLEAEKKMNRADKSYAVMVIDIDKFKSINDIYGYEFGDKLLIIVAKSLRKSLMPGTILCRGVADKFYMFFEFAGKEMFEKQFATLVNNVSCAISQNAPNCNIVLSSGVCVVNSKDKNIISIVDRANIASKQVKNYHESCFAFYDQSMYDRLNKTRVIENQMAASLKNEEFLVYLQPKIRIATKQIAGAEALVRWRHPEKGLIPPNDFIPLFEENGFIVNLDFYMLEQVCKLLERWKHEGRMLFTISINLSRRHLFHADTAQLLSNIVAKYDVDPRLIEVELTESAFNNCDVPTINALFDTLHNNGFTVSIDDFGAGYSSLSLLKDLPIDVLKIDKSLFDCYQICKTDKIGILLESVISLSRKLNIKTVSEGVETEQQVSLLLRLGCDLVQGFYFARPMPIAQLEKILESGDLFCGGDAQILKSTKTSANPQ